MSSDAPLRLDRGSALLRRAAAADVTLAYEDYVLPRDRLVTGEYPVFGERASGAYIWDVDGNRFLDLILAYGTIILGHADAAVSEAVIRQIRDGFAITLRKSVQVELAELLIDTIPGADKVFLLKSGSDATSAAVRVSRAHTGRDRVIRWGYNGWHDWAATRPGGVPRTASDLVTTFDYNDLDSLEAAFAASGGEVACLLMMPFEVEPPAPGFLAGAKEIAHRHGALLVLDEMRTGFRMAPGGAQERYGVRADLATFSKAMANGYPISALAGREDVMRSVAKVHIGSTFHVNGAEMAAAVATITALRTTPVLAEIERLGQRLQDGMSRQIVAHDVPASVLGVPQMPFMRFTVEDADVQSRVQDSFYTHAVRSGLLLHPNHHWYLSGATTDQDIDFALSVTDGAFTAARQTLDDA